MTRTMQEWADFADAHGGLASTLSATQGGALVALCEAVRHEALTEAANEKDATEEETRYQRVGGFDDSSLINPCQRSL